MERTLSRRHAVGRLLAVAGAGMVAASSGQAADEQPHMRAALEALRKAEAELSVATADKGGHRVAAEKLVRQAISEVQAGIGYDNRHP
ncbi:MAG TPA: hypothetical protein PLF26_14685 [Blastocatellia bacterium]|nr:hypothetical protein [Blastocatellia bacterium]